MNNQRFLNFGKHKVIIITAIINGEQFSFHHNILITNNTTFEEYYNLVKDIIVSNYDEGYPVDVIPLFRVMVWNMDHIRNNKIKLTSKAKSASSFKPVQSSKFNRRFPSLHQNVQGKKRCYQSIRSLHSLARTPIMNRGFHFVCGLSINKGFQNLSYNKFIYTKSFSSFIPYAQQSFKVKLCYKELINIRKKLYSNIVTQPNKKYNYIKPIKSKITNTVESFATMDIETINFKNKQIPIAIFLLLILQLMIKFKV